MENFRSITNVYFNKQEGVLYMWWRSQDKILKRKIPKYCHLEFTQLLMADRRSDIMKLHNLYTWSKAISMTFLWGNFKRNVNFPLSGNKLY